MPETTSAESQVQSGIDAERPPVLTIVTALLDGDTAVFQTAECLLAQLSSACRWLIKVSSAHPGIDLGALRGQPHVEIVCEDDHSIYNGLNQALQHLASDWFMVVGAGDRVPPGAVDLMLANLAGAAEMDIVFFATRHLGSGRPLLPRPVDLPVKMACPHPSTVMRSENARQIGGFDTGYKIAADYDLISRYVRAHGRVAWSDQITVEFKGQGLSEHRAIEGALEEELIRRRVWKSSDLDLCERLLGLLPRYSLVLKSRLAAS